jgi:serine phosphatase RsbU (regulator of sigma subunit)
VRLSLLLVEDDEGDAFLVQELLTEAGQPIDMTVVPTVAEATAALERRFDCVLLDLGLPDADGLLALRAVLAVAGDTAVLCLTGLADEHRGVAAVAEGAQDYLVKGHVEADLLVRAIRYAIERRRFVSEMQRLHASQVQVAETARLESGLLPQPDLRDPALRVHTHYRAGRDGVLGGDFYDVVEAGDATAYALIGDVSGHGPDEAALGVSLRIAWRTLVLAGLPHERVLGVLEQVLLRERRHDEVFATVAMLVVAPDRRSVLLYLAGHPAPLSLGALPEQLADDVNGPALGVLPGYGWESARIELPASWRLALFTDGIIEGRTGEGPERLGVEGLLALATGHPDYAHAPALIADLVASAQQAHGGPLADDVAIVVLEHIPAAHPAVPTP